VDQLNQVQVVKEENTNNKKNGKISRKSRFKNSKNLVQVSVLVELENVSFNVQF